MTDDSRAMQGDLVEACARAACKAFWLDSGEDWPVASDEQMEEFYRAARAVIPIIVEACASLVEGDIMLTLNDHDLTGFEQQNGLARSISRKIRALAQRDLYTCLTQL